MARREPGRGAGSPGPRDAARAELAAASGLRAAAAECRLEEHEGGSLAWLALLPRYQIDREGDSIHNAAAELYLRALERRGAHLLRAAGRTDLLGRRHGSDPDERGSDVIAAKLDHVQWSSDRSAPLSDCHSQWNDTLYRLSIADYFKDNVLL